LHSRNLFDRAAFAALWLFTCTIPFEKSVEIAGVGSISKLAGLVAAAFGVLAVVLSRRVRMPGASLILAAAFVAWSAVSRFWSLSPADTQERAGTYAPLLLIAALCWQFCRTRQEVRSLAIAYSCGIAACVANTIYRWLSGAGQVYYQRYAGEGFDPNDLALTLAIGIPFLYWLSLTASSNAAAWMWRLLLAGAAFNIFLTASRGGVMAMGVAMLFVPATFGLLRKHEKAMLVAAAAAAAIAVMLLVPATSWARIATLGKEAKEGTLNSRTVIWSSGLAAFASHPVTGVGSGAFPESIRETMGRPRDWTPVAHNTFLSILVETGLTGFAIFALFAASLLLQVRRMPVVERRLWIVVLCVWATGVSALTWEHRKPTWMLFALLPAHAAAIRATAARTVHEEFAGYGAHA
jgi:O-antigen ligase